MHMKSVDRLAHRDRRSLGYNMRLEKSLNPVNKPPVPCYVALVHREALLIFLFGTPILNVERSSLTNIGLGFWLSRPEDAKLSQ